MSKQTPHTTEPWDIGGNFFREDGAVDCNIWGPTPPGMQSGTIVAQRVSIPDARRIIACISACSEMADPAAEIAALKERVAELQIQLDNTDVNLEQARLTERHKFEKYEPTRGEVRAFMARSNPDMTMYEAETIISEARSMHLLNREGRAV